jgi:hypothetical protein
MTFSQNFWLLVLALLVIIPSVVIGGIIGSSLERRRVDSWGEKNQRRLDLIDKHYSIGLTDEETAELSQLTSEIYEHMQAIDPRPVDLADEDNTQ